MKNLLLMIALGALSGTAISQINVTFKPGPAVGEDAVLFKLDNGCVPNDGSLPSTPELLNFGSTTDLAYFDWTFNAYGCSGGTGRTLIRFAGLNSIPIGAIITSATLKLYGKSTAEFITLGNSSYPGDPYGTTNEGYVRRVSPGSAYAWDESTVTWASPALTYSGSPISIPVSASQWNWNTSINVTSMVQNIVNELATDPFANNGFMLMLQNETHYRSVVFASSDHSNRALWPELEVTYIFRKANFTSDAPYSVSFNLNNITNEQGFDAAQLTSTTSTYEHSSPKWQPLKGDVILPLHVNEIDISPNPATTEWTVRFNAAQDRAGELLFYNMKSQLVKREKIQLKAGENYHQINTQGLSSGMYIIEIRSGETTTLRGKAIKK